MTPFYFQKYELAESGWGLKPTRPGMEFIVYYFDGSRALILFI